MVLELKLETFSLSELENGIVHLMLDMPSTSANVLTEQLFSDLVIGFDAIDEYASSSADAVRGVVIQSAKDRIFVAGADLKRIARTLKWPDEKIVAFCQDGKDIFARFQSNTFPVVAAVHGACVGGGFELALWCDARVAANDRSTFFGLPEVRLGLVPGWAGTCILPRLIGSGRAAEMTSLAENINSLQAAELGAVDAVSEKENLLDVAIALIEHLNESQEFIERRKDLQHPVGNPAPVAMRDEIYSKIQAAADVDEFAGTIVLDQILDTSSVDLKQACDGENIAMTKVYGSDSSSGLLNTFFLNEHARKITKSLLVDQQQPVKSIGVIGVGQMGLGLAQLLRKNGFEISVFDKNPQTLSNAESVISCIDGENAFHVCQSVQDMADCDLIVESIVEDVEVKRTLLADLSESVRADTIIATNTSVICLAQLVDAVSNPERFCAMHFCSPILESTLVEIAQHPNTSSQTIAAVASVSKAIKKNPVLLNDGPGFVVNRLLTPLFDAANRILIGGSSLESIDQAWREFGFMLGPYEMMDLIGLDIVYQAGKTHFATSPGDVFVTPLLPKMVKNRWLGMKTKTGFYDYEGIDLRQVSSDPAPLNPHMTELVAEYQTGNEQLTPKQIADRIFVSMLSEAEKLMEQGIASDPRDVDLCMIHGLRFPADKGGLLHWAGWLGEEEIGRMTEQTNVKLGSNDFRYSRFA